jgi:hypothetical protein
MEGLNRTCQLVEFELNYSLTLESEKDTRSPTGKLTSWLTGLSAVLQKLVLRSAWLCVLAKPAEAAGIPLWPPPPPTPPLMPLGHNVNPRGGTQDIFCY